MASSRDSYNEAKIDIFISWPKEVVEYYRKCLEPDINSMANWSAKEFGFELVSTNAAESHNAVIKRKNYNNLPMRLDDMMLSCLRNVELTLNKIDRSLYRVGGDYALLDELFPLYPTQDCPTLREITAKQIKDRRIEARVHLEKYQRSITAKPKYVYTPIYRYRKWESFEDYWREEIDTHPGAKMLGGYRFNWKGLHCGFVSQWHLGPKLLLHLFCNLLSYYGGFWIGGLRKDRIIEDSSCTRHDEKPTEEK